MNLCPHCGRPLGSLPCASCFPLSHHGVKQLTAGAARSKLNEDPILYGEPIIGWRIWGVQGNHLVTGMYSSEWPHKKPLTAVHEERSPYPYNSAASCPGSPCEPHTPNILPGCGIYALKTPADIAAEWEEHRAWPGIVGTVYLWGRMFEHEHGYRAQFAYPASFIAAFGGADIDALAAAYNVPTDKENLTWKSVSRLAELLQNRSSSRPPLGNLYPMLPPNPMYLPPSPPPTPASSTSLLVSPPVPKHRFLSLGSLINWMGLRKEEEE